MLLVPYKYGEAFFIEKRSKFTGRVWRCDTEEEALQHIADMRTEFWNATHNVYAYIVADGQVSRFSDDGEPQGTAGVPVLEVFKRENISNVCCVVTRYFGGILLGAGGLVRAYSKAAKLALDAAGIAQMQPVSVLEITCPYSLFDRIKSEIDLFKGQISNTDYTAEVKVEVSIPEEDCPSFIETIKELSSGTVIPTCIRMEHMMVRLH